MAMPRVRICVFFIPGIRWIRGILPTAVGRDSDCFLSEPWLLWFLWLFDFGWKANCFREGLHRLAVIWRPFRAGLNGHSFFIGNAESLYLRFFHPRHPLNPCHFTDRGWPWFWLLFVWTVIIMIFMIIWFWLKCILLARGAAPPRCYMAPLQGWVEWPFVSVVHPWNPWNPWNPWFWQLLLVWTMPAAAGRIFEIFMIVWFYLKGKLISRGVSPFREGLHRLAVILRPFRAGLKGNFPSA